MQPGAQGDPIYWTEATSIVKCDGEFVYMSFPATKRGVRVKK